jgi:ABC-type transporter MlaC component
LLGIRNKNNRQVTGIPNVMVSDTLVHLIFKILDGSNITKSDLSVLKPHEKIIYDKLMKLSGFYKTMVNSVDDTLSEIKKRLELISGEIEAGNNNKELLKEAHQILHSMAQMKVITHVEASKYYKDLKSFF